ncbi:hypothetical protein BDY19DRAFT_260981 [Irpex rosettiformis]|uniref:Uncharacterized protein n=1 Tax=Irpex rosettiformis TaxID=378272 RepID=A0ACB8UH15_9APHY|nr:hypothetical protein BDY19DRAFT_260981 [Irpex rosettiformis]
MILSLGGRLKCSAAAVWGLHLGSCEPLATMEVPPSVQHTLRDIQIAKHFFLAGYCILLYDHIITLSQEIEVIWKRQKTYIAWLFILLRYYSILVITVVCVGSFSAAITRERCAHWILFLPLGMTMPLSLLPSILMSIRVWAMYNANRYLLTFLLVYLAAETAAGLWEYTASGETPALDPLDNYEYHFCMYLPPKKIGHASILFLSMELTFDSICFLLTVSRTVYMHYHHQATIRQSGLPVNRSRWSTSIRRRLHKRGLLSSLVQDGALYFAAIFSINLIWVVMILHAPTDLRGLASQPSACLMTTIICRITMNLRTTAYDSNYVVDHSMNASQSHWPGDDAAYPNHRTFEAADRSIPLSTFCPAVGIHSEMDDEGGYGVVQVSLRSHNSDVKDEDESPTHEVAGVLKPFSNGNGYGEYAACQHERAFKDV